MAQEFSREAAVEQVVQRSRFIGCAVRLLHPPGELDDAPLARVRQEFPGASHYCWAYRWEAGQERAEDAGEPRGTAGLPILSVLQREQLIHALVVVVRYFGGVKLGRAGLFRAYHDAALAAAAAAHPEPLVPVTRVRLTCAYPAFDAVRRWLEDLYRATRLERPSFIFGEAVHWTGLLPAGALEAAAPLWERWHGQVEWAVESEALAVWPRADAAPPA